MALTATSVIEIQSGGNSLNAGAFDPTVTSPGTDYTQQTSAQRSWLSGGGTFTNNLAATNVTNSVITSASYNFVGADVGNCIHITAGTHFTAGYYIITSVAGNAATISGNCTDAAADATGGSGYQGGAVDLLSTAGTFAVGGNVVYLKQATYTSATNQSITFTGTTASPIKVVGYNTTRSVGMNTDTKPVMNCSGNAITVITLNAVISTYFYNIRVTSTGATKGVGYTSTGNSTGVRFSNCEVDTCGVGWNGGSSSSSTLRNAVFENCVVRNCANDAWRMSSTTATTWILIGCWADSNTGASTNGFVIGNANSHTVYIRDCAFTDNGLHGISFAGTTQIVGRVSIENCILENNAGDGLNSAFTSGTVTTLWSFMNNIIYGNAGYGVNCATASILDQNAWTHNNAYGNNNGGGAGLDVLNFTKGSDDITLTADPFTNRSSDDYSLNNTTGGGALLKGLGFPVRMGSNTYNAANNYIDVGAQQANIPTRSFAF